MQALTFSHFGGPEVLQFTTLTQPELLPGTVLLRTQAIGLNFADIYRRQGNYHLVGEPPYILGYEAAGIVEAVAPDVQGIEVGQRAAFADVPHANAELVRVPAEHLLPLPDDVTAEQAAALLLQGLTAQYLTSDSYAIQPGTVAVVHAVAGGVGQLLTQFIKLLGGYVIGLTSSEEKRELALHTGADSVLLYQDDWVKAVQHLCPEAGGADVVYDSVGSTLLQSLEAVRTGGHVVFYGMAGGNPAPIDPRQLMDSSKTLTGGDLWSYFASPTERIKRAAALFELVRQGKLQATICARFPLAEGAKAHQLLESRRSTGKILLIP